jgi:hypothetical protein
MKPTLTSLWFGQLCPADQLSANYHHREQLRNLDIGITRDIEALRKTLPKDACDILERCIERIYERQGLSDADAFINGFSLGVKIITEAVTEY